MIAGITGWKFIRVTKLCRGMVDMTTKETQKQHTYAKKKRYITLSFKVTRS